MPINIKPPHITSVNGIGQIEQLKTYLIQLSGELNWALGSINDELTKASNGDATALQSKATSQAASQTEAQATFNSIKSLIIKSADIVNAYTEVIDKTLSGKYVATSDFGTYMKENESALTITPEFISQNYYSKQDLETAVNVVNKVIESEGYIKTGEIATDEHGYPVYGVEVGATVDADGQQIYRKYARYTAGGIELYDAGSQEKPVATIYNYKMTITNAEITGTLALGRFAWDYNDVSGLTLKWK